MAEIPPFANRGKQSFFKQKITKGMKEERVDFLGILRSGTSRIRRPSTVYPFSTSNPKDRVFFTMDTKDLNELPPPGRSIQAISLCYTDLSPGRAVAD